MSIFGSNATDAQGGGDASSSGASGSGGGSFMPSLSASIGDKIFSKKEASKARSWNLRHYKRRYQYAVEDMRKAGLNPLLAAGGGLGGGSGPTGAQAAQSNTSDVSRVVNETKMMRANVENLMSSTERNKADAALLAEKMLTEKSLQNLHLNSAENVRQKNVREAPVTNLVEGSDISTTATHVAEKAKELGNQLFKDATKYDKFEMAEDVADWLKSKWNNLRDKVRAKRKSRGK